MAGGETPKVDAPVVTDAPAPSQPTNFDPPIDTKPDGNPVSVQDDPPKVTGDENTAEPGRPGFGDQIPQIESLGSFVDKDKNGKDDKTGKPKEDGEPEVVEATDTLTPEEQASADVAATKNGPPQEPEHPKLPEVAVNHPNAGTKDVIEAQRKAEQDPTYQREKKQYDKDKAKYDKEKAIYDAAVERIKARTTLPEADKNTLGNGGDVTIDAERKAYLKKYLALTAGDSDNAKQFNEYASKNPALKGNLASAAYILSSDQVISGKDKSRGSLSQLPKGLRKTLTNSEITHKWTTTGSVAGEDPHTVTGIDVPRLKEYQNLVDILRSSDPRYRNGSDISRALIRRADDIAKAKQEADVTDVYGSRERYDFNMFNGAGDGHDEKGIDKLLEDMLSVGSDDHAAVVNAMSGRNMERTGEPHYGASEASKLINRLANHNWDGSDVSGTLGQQSGEYTVKINSLNEKIKTASGDELKSLKAQREELLKKQKNLAKLLEAHPGMKDATVANPNSGVVKFFRQLQSRDDDPETQHAANNVAHNLKADKQYYKNTGVIQALSAGMSPYWDALAGNVKSHPKIHAFPDKKFTLPSFMKLTFADPVAAATTTSAVKYRQSEAARDFGEQNTGDFSSEYGETIGSLQIALEQSAADAHFDEKERATYAATLRSTTYDVASGGLLAAVGAIPVVGPVLAIPGYAGNPVLKASLSENGPNESDSSDIQKYIAATDQRDIALIGAIKGISKWNPRIKEDDKDMWDAAINGKDAVERADAAAFLIDKYGKFSSIKFEKSIDDGRTYMGTR